MARDNEFRIKLIADANEAKKSIEQTGESFSKLTRKVDELTKASKVLAKADSERTAAATQLKVASTDAEEKIAKAKLKTAETAVRSAEKEVKAKEQSLKSSLAIAEKEIANSKRLEAQAEKTAAVKLKAEEKSANASIKAAEKIIAANEKATAKALAQIEKASFAKLKAEEKGIAAAIRNAERESKTRDEFIRRSTEIFTRAADSRKKAAEKQAAADKKAGASVRDFGKELGDAALKGLGFESTLAQASAVLGPLAAGLAVTVGALTAYVGLATKAAVDTASYAKEQKNLRLATGASSEFLAAFTLALKRNGGDIKESVDSLQQLGQAINEAAAEPLGKAAKNFEDLGVSVTTTTGRVKSAEEVFREIDKIFKEVGRSQKNIIALATILGEESAKKVIPFIGTLTALEEEARKAGLVLSDKVAAAAEKATANFFALQAELDGFTKQIGAELLPAFDEVTTSAREAFKELAGNENFKEGLKGIIELTVEFIKGAGPIFVEILSLIAKQIATVGRGLNALANAGERLQIALGLTSKATKESNKETEKQEKVLKEAAKAIAEESAAAAVLAGRLKTLGEAQARAAAFEKALNTLRIQALQLSVDKGIIAETEGIKQISALKEAELQKDIKRAEAFLALTKENKQNTLEAETKLVSALAALDQERTNKAKALIEAGSRFRTKAIAEITKAEEVANAQTLALIEQAQRARILALDEETEAIKKARRDRIISITEEASQLNQAESKKLSVLEESAKKRISLQRQVFQLELLNIDGILAREDILQKEREEAESKRKVLIADIAKFEIGAIDSTKKAITDRAEFNIKAIELQRQAENTQREEALAKDQARFDFQESRNARRLEQLKRDGATEREIANETDRLARKSLDAQIEAKERQIQLKKQEGASDAEIIKLQQEIFELENQRKDLIRGITGAVVDLANKEQEALNDLANSTDKVKSATDTIASTAQKSAAVVGETAKVTRDNIDELLQDAGAASLEAVNAVLKFGPIAGKVIQDAAEDTYKSLLRIKSGFNAIDAAKEFERIREAQRDAAKSAFEAGKEFVEKELELEQAHDKNLRKLENQRHELKTNFIKDEVQKAKDQNNLEVSFAKERDAALTLLAEKFAKEDLDRATELADQKRDAAKAVEDEINSNFRSALVTRSNLEKAARAAAEAAAKAPSDLGLIDAAKQAQDELDKFNGTADKKDKALKDKQAAIDKARAESKSAAEFERRKEEIEANFRLDQDAIEQREQLIANGDFAKLEALNKSIADEKAANAKAREDDLKDLAAKQAEEAANRELERQQIIDEYALRLADSKTAFDEAQKERQREYDEQLKAINKQINKENTAYAKQQDDLKAQFAETLNDLGDSLKAANAFFDSFFGDVLKRIGVTGDAFDELFGKIGQLSAQSNAAIGAANSVATGQSNSSQNTNQQQNNQQSDPGASSRSGGEPSGPQARTQPNESDDTPNRTVGGSKFNAGDKKQDSQGMSPNITDAKSYRKLMIQVYELNKDKPFADAGKTIDNATFLFAVSQKIIRNNDSLPIELDNLRAQANIGLGKSRKNFVAIVDDIIDYVESQPAIKDVSQGGSVSSIDTGARGEREKGEENDVRGKSVAQERNAKFSPVLDKSRKSPADISRGDTRFDDEDAALRDAQTAGLSRAGSTVADRKGAGDPTGNVTIGAALQNLNVYVTGPSSADIARQIAAAFSNPTNISNMEKGIESKRQTKAFNANPAGSIRGG